MRYTEDHEWARLEGGVVTIGISAYAVEQLGDVVYVELPEIGKKVTAHGEMALVESAKAASDVFAPIAGEIVEVNAALAADPELVNKSPEADGWFVKLKPADPAALDALMDKAAYDAFVQGLG
ncbi:MAG: glycine cleavage system protein GcvH [Hyphomonadaceae bacterium]|nr:glycine cleavage system protein GcvH [Hyphomonadaceae bacterium]